jgi:thiamine kinase-like enzyme
MTPEAPFKDERFPMASEVTQDLFLSLMPELEGLNLEIIELKGGITNNLYRVRSSDGHDYVFRFYGEKTDLFINRNTEADNLRRMCSTGVTPGLIRYLPERNTTVTEFIPGYVLRNQDFLKEDLWELIVRPIKRIHQSGIALPFVFRPYAEVKRLRNILERVSVRYSEFDIDGTVKTLEKISELPQVASCHAVPCHNDLLAGNFILTEDGGKSKEPMFLIDWEYGGMAPIYYDIADMFQEILVPRAVERTLLRIYWENQDVDAHGYMTDLFKPFPDIYWFLWSLIQLNISTIPFDYYGYGKAKYENAQRSIAYLRDSYRSGI